MSKPWLHAESSAKRFGGVPEDYLAIHEFIDSSKAAIADSRHRALTHTSWFLSTMLPVKFGDVKVNSEGKTYSVRDVGEQHVLEDYGGKFIPTPQDFFESMPFADWMENGKGTPPSFAKLAEHGAKKASSYAAARERIKAEKEEGARIAKEAFAEGAAELFAAYPVLESFGWRQYTPYFNDGDACVFGVRCDEPEINGSDEWDKGYTYEAKRDKRTGRSEYVKIETGPPSPEYLLREPVAKFISLFSEEDMEAMFGDHVKVMVRRDGTSETREYSHD